MARTVAKPDSVGSRRHRVPREFRQVGARRHTALIGHLGSSGWAVIVKATVTWPMKIFVSAVANQKTFLTTVV